MTRMCECHGCGKKPSPMSTVVSIFILLIVFGSAVWIGSFKTPPPGESKLPWKVIHSESEMKSEK